MIRCILKMRKILKGILIIGFLGLLIIEAIGRYYKLNIVSVQKVMGKKGKSDREKLTCVRWMISYAK